MEGILGLCVTAFGIIMAVFCIRWLAKFWRFRGKKYSDLSLVDKETLYSNIKKWHYKESPEEFLKKLKSRSIIMLCLTVSVLVSLLLIFGFVLHIFIDSFIS